MIPIFRHTVSLARTHNSSCSLPEKPAELETIYREAYADSQATGWVRDKMGVFDNFNPAVHYIMPIPQAEICRNALIPQSEQNEGWGGNRKWK